MKKATVFAALSLSMLLCCFPTAEKKVQVETVKNVDKSDSIRIEVLKSRLVDHLEAATARLEVLESAP